MLIGAQDREPKIDKKTEYGYGRTVGQKKSKATFYCLMEARAMLAPTSKSHEFVVASGLSMHMLSKKVLSSDEMETPQPW